MLRAIVPNLEEGILGDTFLFRRGGNVVRVGTVFPNDDDRAWRRAWVDVTEADLQLFCQEGYFIPIDGDRYALVVQKVIDAVKTNFGIHIETAPQKPATSSQHKIFLSYSHDDERITEELASLLGKAYHDVWYDRSSQGLRGGQLWWEEIQKKIANCDVFIFIMSSEALMSEWCVKELEEARKLEKYIIPIRVRRQIDNIPPWINELHIIYMSSGRVEITSLNDLYTALINIGYGQENTTTTALTQPQSHVYRLTDSAKEWAKAVVLSWNNGDLDPTFTLVDLSNDTGLMKFGYGLGVADAALPPPSLGVLNELVQANLIDMGENYTAGRNRTWQVTLTQKLHDAVASGFRE